MKIEAIHQLAVGMWTRAGAHRGEDHLEIRSLDDRVGSMALISTTPTTIGCRQALNVSQAEVVVVPVAHRLHYSGQRPGRLRRSLVRLQVREATLGGDATHRHALQHLPHVEAVQEGERRQLSVL